MYCSTFRKLGLDIYHSGPNHISPQVRIFGVTVLVAAWWLDAAARGIPPTIPVVNFNTVIMIHDEGGGVDGQKDGHNDEKSTLNNNDILKLSYNKDVRDDAFNYHAYLLCVLR